MARVLVTGGAGFVAAHCLAKLLADGHETRATVRDLAREGELRAMLTRGGVGEVGGRLALARADLNADAGWREAAEGCDYVLHVASPFPASAPRDENELIAPARDGALRVLKAARAAGVKRVVLTSSFAAIGYGHPDRAAPFTEADWTRADDPGLQPYPKSKTLAERAAWDYAHESGLELAVVNPVGVFGPALGPDLSTSVVIIRRLLDGAVPGCPDIWFGAVDVRDVADLHVQAMTDPRAAGERFIATAGDFLSLRDMALRLKKGLGEAARKVPTRALPNWLVRAASWFDPTLRGVVPELGKRKTASNAKARERLGWSPRPPEEAILSSARSLLELGLVKRN